MADDVGVLERVTVPLATVATVVPFADNVVVVFAGNVVVPLVVCGRVPAMEEVLVEINEDVFDRTTAIKNEMFKKRRIISIRIMRRVMSNFKV